MQTNNENTSRTYDKINLEVRIKLSRPENSSLSKFSSKNIPSLKQPPNWESNYQPLNPLSHATSKKAPSSK